jgi:Na+-transporting methylmalonyl-CoA/oxaloacetate decarboxylase gamma subunit
MSSPTTFTTLVSTSVVASASATSTSTSGHGTHSDKIAIIGMTIGIVFAFLVFILPCICFQGLAHWQQKREEKQAARERAKADAAVGRVIDEQRRLNILEQV